MGEINKLLYKSLKELDRELEILDVKLTMLEKEAALIIQSCESLLSNEKTFS